MNKLLEVIVTSAAEAVVAVCAGADRLELVRDLETGGLTPEFETVDAVVQAVSVPVRVMLRENASMFMASVDELRVLEKTTAKFQGLRIDGLVLGWVTGAGEVDEASLSAVLGCAPGCKVTFHRAFEHLADPFEGLKVLKKFKQIDRILTGGGPGSWPERKRRLHEWGEAMGPEIGLLVGGGLLDEEIADVMADKHFSELHVGRAARTPQENDGVLDGGKIALLKSRRGS